MRPVANNALRLREVNSELVRDALRASGGMTKAELAAATGLSVATCANIVAEMLARGEVLPRERDDSTGGRPPMRYVYNPAYSLSVLVVALWHGGERALLHSVVDAAGSVVEEGRSAPAKIDAAAVDKLLSGLMARHANVRTAALSIPGVVKNGTVGVCDLPELEGTDIEARIRSAHGIEAAAENDVNLAALGFRAGRPNGSDESLLYFHMPRKSCAGAGVVVDGRLVRGVTGFAGEVSFMPVGVPRRRQFSGLARDRALAYAALVVSCMVPVVNPDAVAFTGYCFRPGDAERMRELCLESIPEAHMPELVRRESFDEDCLAGLKMAAAASLACKVRLVRNEKGMVAP